MKPNYRVNPTAGVTAVPSATARSPAAGYAGRWAKGSMIRIRYARGQGVEVEGTAEELDYFRQEVLMLASHGKGSIAVMAEAGFDPAPYECTITMAVLTVGSGAAMVEVNDGTELIITASSDNLRRFASFLDVPEAAQGGWHSHCEYFAGNEFMMASSEPVTISLRRLTSA